MQNRVLVATSCRAENARYVDFYRMRDDLILPEGSEKKLFPGFFPDYNINDAVKIAIRDNFSHLFILDDDQICPPDTVMKLLNRQVDIVSVNLLSRMPPFNPYIFSESPLEEGREKGLVIQEVLEGSGLIERAACGTGGILIRTNVFKTLKFPWFTHNENLKTYDFYFCHMARQAGYKIYIDLDVVSGHLVIGTVWPNKIDGEWVTTLVINNAIRFNVPCATKKEDGTLEMAGVLK